MKTTFFPRTNLKVRFRNQSTNSTLVASTDKESVMHVRLDDNTPKPDNSVWFIMNTHPYQVHIKSIYGKLLGWGSIVTGLIAIQVDERSPRSKLDRTWWSLEDVDNSGLTRVRIRICREEEGFNTIYLYPDDPQLKLDNPKEQGQGSLIWDLEIIEDTTKYIPMKVFPHTNFKVRLRNQSTNATLVASTDKESVMHVRLGDDTPKPDNSVWFIMNTHPYQVQIKSIYGKLLGWSSTVTGLIVDQVDEQSPRSKLYRTWWSLENIDNSGLTRVRIRICSEEQGFKTMYLYPDSPKLKLDNPKEQGQGSLIWDLEIVKDKTIDQGRVINKPDNNPQETVAYTTTSSVNQMNVINNVYSTKTEWTTAAASFLFPNNYVNSGHCVNNSGTQTVGGVSVQTRIGYIVNNFYVRDV